MRNQAMNQIYKNNSMEGALDALRRALPDGPIRAALMRPRFQPLSFLGGTLPDSQRATCTSRAFA